MKVFDIKPPKMFVFHFFGEKTEAAADEKCISAVVLDCL